MTNYAIDPSHPLVRRLAEQALAADLFHAIADGAASAAQDSVEESAQESPLPSLPMRALLAYVRRDHSAPADFAIERAIRTDPAVARRYRNLLAGMALAFSPVALAAATEPVPSRVLGQWRLRVSEPEGLSPVLVLEPLAPSPAPTAIEAVGPSGGPIRLMLPEPVNQAIQLPLDGEFAELAAFRRLIADPATSIALMP
jgi:hypothetical protein